MRVTGKRLSAVSLSVLLLAGCSPSVGDADARDRATPAFDRAIKQEQVGQLDEAITQYEAVLLDHPRLVSAHLHLALLLHDHRQDYVGAVYHYQQYLKLRPGGEKDEMIEGRIRLAEQLLAAQLLRRVGDVAGIAQTRLTAEIDSLNARCAALEGEKSALVEEKGKLVQALQASQAETQRLRRLVDNMQLSETTQPPPERPKTTTLSRLLPRKESETAAEPARSSVPPLSRDAIIAAREEAAKMAGGTASGDTAAPVKPSAAGAVAVKPSAATSGSAPTPAGGGVRTDAGSSHRTGTTNDLRRTPTLRTYVVQPGDTLYGIAERHYGDASHWVKVRDANKTRLGPDNRVRAGQILLIP